MIHLRELVVEDAEGMLEWMHDPNIQQSFQIDMAGKTLEDVREFIEAAQYIMADGSDMHFAIAGEMDEYMGTISLKNISLRDRRAEYAISLRKCIQGKGVGYAATFLLLDYAFYALKLNRIFLNVLSDNVAAIHLYQKCGFHYEGKFSEHLFLQGQYHDLLWYGITIGEYCGRNPNRAKPDTFYSRLL